jgi:heterodisulfide reductase subunit C
MASTVDSPQTSLPAEIRRRTGINVATCYQCGKCSAGCPMAAECDLRPHNVMRLAMTGRRSDLMADESIWLCLTCETCSARCPNGCDPARVIDAVREIAAESGVSPQQRNIRAFHKSFLEQVRLSGRLFEAGFMVTYKMRSGTLFQDALAAPGMDTRGKLPALPSRVKDTENVRRIFRLCEPDAGAQAGGASSGSPAGGAPSGDGAAP